MEVWRFATSFLYEGNLREFRVLILLYLIWIHARQYEANPHPAGGGRPADAAFALLFCMMMIVASYLAVDEFGLYPFRARRKLLHPLFAKTLVYAGLYLWSRRNPRARVNLNFIPMEGRYLPFAYAGFSVATGNRMHELFHGIVVAHIYYCLVEIVPTVLGRRVLTTPRLLTELFGGGHAYNERVVMEDYDVGHESDDDVGLTSMATERSNNVPASELEPSPDLGATQAHIAAKMGSLEALRLLARTGEGRATFRVPDSNGWQPLHEAVRGGFVDIVNLLVEHDVDINARTGLDGTGPSPLWLAEMTHRTDHPVALRLRRLEAVRIDPD